MISRWLINRLSTTPPEARRLYAARILVISLAGWIGTHILFLVMGITGVFEHVLNLISWWAITLTAWDILATSDVKVDTDNGESKSMSVGASGEVEVLTQAVGGAS